MLEFAGDFLKCCAGEGTTERGPWGEKAGGGFEVEKGVETGGVATACAAFRPGVGVAMLEEVGAAGSEWWWRSI